MPYRIFGIDEVARYLHLSRGDVERLVKNQDIPFEKLGQKIVFRKVDIDSWASPRILGLPGRRLAEYHRKTSRDSALTSSAEAIMPRMLLPEFINSSLPAKTKASALREMAALAGRTGRVCDQAALIAGLQAREELCSTGLPGGLALLHCRYPEPYLFESAFIVVGRTVQQIPFGAPDGKPTDLFFLLACPDPQLHLHTLARLCMMVQKTQLLDELRQAESADMMHQSIIDTEAALLNQPSAD